MRDYAIAGGVIAVLVNSEVFSLALLLIACAYGVYKLFSAAAKEGR